MRRRNSEKQRETGKELAFNILVLILIVLIVLVVLGVLRRGRARR